MEMLKALVNTKLSKSKFTRRLDSSAIGDQVIKEIRLVLYNEAKAKGLMEEGDKPVTRIKSATGNSMKKKHIDEIWCVMGSIMNSKGVD